MKQDSPVWIGAPVWPEQFMPAMDLAGGPATLRYAICATPRSGSNFLGHMLKNTGLFGCPLEYFNPDHLPTWRKRAAREGFDSVMALLESRRTSANGRFGLKIHRTHLATAVAEVGPGFLGPDWKFILLRRRDVLAQALSWSIAAQTAVWKSGLPAKGEAVYSRSAIARRIELAVKHTASWQQLFAERGIVPLELAYEDIESDPAAALRTVADFLETPLPATLDLGRLIETRRQRSTGSQAWRRRFVEETNAVPVEAMMFEFVESRRAALLREARCRLRRVAGRLQGLRAGLPLALWSAGAALSLMLDAIGPA
ncbi:MAG: Stf0 family sulfotransferase [Dongiaceae bacterium]